jgi:hypothetical protein
MARNRLPDRESFANTSRPIGANGANNSTLRNGTQQNETEQIKPPLGGEDRRTISRQATKGVAMKLFGDIRAARIANHTPHGIRYHIPKDFIESLDGRTLAAVTGLGGPHLIAGADEEKLPILRSQFAEMYLAVQ